MLYIIYQKYNITNELINTLKIHYSDIKFINMPNWYSNLNIFQRLLYKISKVLNWNIGYKFVIPKEILKQLKEISHNDKILFWDYVIDVIDIKYIINLIKIPVSSIHIWLWNTIDYYNVDIIEGLNKNDISLYTFDPIDAKRYNIKLLNQTCCKKKVREQDVKFDFFFIGIDKGRSGFLSKLKENLSIKGYKCKFIICNDKNCPSTFYSNLEYIDKQLSYDEMLALLLQSKVVVDLTKSNQMGLTLRVLESIFYRKKLITNNRSIVQMDIYKKSNILIMNQDFDFVTQIDDFINLPLESYKTGIIEKYYIENWISYFLKE